MSETIIAVMLQQLGSILAEQAAEEIELVFGVKKEIRSIERTYMKIQAVLSDAMERQIADESVRLWLNELRNVSYDIGDVLDEWNTALLKIKIERKFEGHFDNTPTSSPNTTSKIEYGRQKITSLFTSCMCFRQLSLRRDIAIKIKKLHEKLVDIAKERENFRFNETRTWQQPSRLTASIIDETEVHGRSSDRQAIMDKLMSESNQQNRAAKVISIVGMGGMGKTVLGQCIYGHKAVKTHFDCKVWVCVSNHFDQVKIAKAIIEKIAGSSPNFNNLDPLLERIQEITEGKRLLIVLDDVWTEDRSKWEQLKSSLTFCKQGSKILVTTRKHEVACMMESTYAHSLKELGEGDCWSLFEKMALEGRINQECEEFEKIGQELVKKCKGIPLAVKALGCLMRQKEETRDWQNALKSKIWDLQEIRKDLSPSLLLSYYDLPPAVRLCFSYCAIFPKGKEIHKDELVKLWMAQGFLDSGGDEEVEDLADQYFKCLASRSFFQDIKRSKLNGDVESFKMNDIVHDLAYFLSESECLAIDTTNASLACEGKKLSSYTRHLTVEGMETAQISNSIWDMRYLRTLLVHNNGSLNEDFYFCFPRLRAVKLRRALPEVLIGIESLIHLRHLDLKNNNTIDGLPEMLCELCNLQTLILSGCRNLETLPRSIGKLVNLKHLDLEGCFRLRYVPKGICMIGSSLKTLSLFPVSDDPESCRLGDLRDFSSLRGRIVIYKLRSTDLAEVEKADLKRKSISSMSIFASTEVDYNKNALSTLLSDGLEELRIISYGGSSILNSIMSLTNLRQLVLCRCTGLNRMPSLGKLPALAFLSVDGLLGVQKIGYEFLGMQRSGFSKKLVNSIAFPKLNCLEFGNMSNWTDWDSSIAKEPNVKIMPCLTSLSFSGCPRLKALPHFLKRTPLESLHISTCEILEVRCKEHRGADWSTIAHVPNVHISNSQVYISG